MFRNMRRNDRQMDDQKAYQLLEKGIDGVLGTISDNGYPYTVPVNYALIDQKIYFHSALDGHKIDNILTNSKVSFTVIEKNEIIEHKFTTDYKSVIVFGTAKLITPSKEILMALIHKYSPNFIPEGKNYVAKSFETTQLVEITIDHITGKERSK